MTPPIAAVPVVQVVAVGLGFRWEMLDEAGGKIAWGVACDNREDAHRNFAELVLLLARADWVLVDR